MSDAHLNPLPGFMLTTLALLLFAFSGLATAATPEPSVPPTVSSLKLTPDHFQIRAKRGPRHALRGGSVISFVLSAPAEVKLVVAAPPGCVSRAATAKIAKACFPLTEVYGLFSVAGHAGSNTISFSGELHRRPLRQGTYRIEATPAGTGRGAKATFTIL